MEAVWPSGAPCLAQGAAFSLFAAAILWLPLLVEPAYLLRRLESASDRALNSPMAVLVNLDTPGEIHLWELPAGLRNGFTLVCLVCVALVLLAMLRSRREPSEPFRQYLRAGGLVLAVYYYVQSWWFFPWYLCWAVPFASLSFDRRIGKFLIVLSASAMFGFVVNSWWDFVGVQSHAAHNAVASAVIFIPPLIYLLVSWLRRSRTNTADMTSSPVSVPAKS